LNIDPSHDGNGECKQSDIIAFAAQRFTHGTARVSAHPVFIFSKRADQRTYSVPGLLLQMNKSLLKSPASLWTLIWAILLVNEVYASIRLTGGHLIYSLDDPYIHLSVAENILRGGYGVNWEEYLAPCSSILYPFLLVPFVAIGIGTFAPLIINALAMGFSARIYPGLHASPGSPQGLLHKKGLDLNTQVFLPLAQRQGTSEPCLPR
jgi:hypothetical protein